MRTFGRRSLSFLLMTVLLFPARLADGIPPVPSQTIDALAAAPPFFLRSSCAPAGLFLRQALAWFRGDPALVELRKPYRPQLRQSFLLMAGDAAATLVVPFIGQALYDTAARGSAAPGALPMMVGVSGLLILVEGLDPLRRYVQFRLAEVSSGFVADVRSFLLERAWASDSPDPARPGLIYFHAPSFAVRNIEIPLKLPLNAGQGLLSTWLLWQRDPIIAGVAAMTALGLAVWSRGRSQPLAQTSRGLRQAESEALALVERSASRPASESLREARLRFDQVRRMEIQQARQGVWYDAVVDRVSTLVLMTGVMLWGAWHQYSWGSPSTGQILTLLALAWNVQYRTAAVLALVRKRLEAEGAAFLLRDADRKKSKKECRRVQPRQIFWDDLI